MTTVHPEDGHLQAYLDSELTLDATNVVERHLLKCPRCRERVDELRAVEESTAGALGALDPVVDVEAALWEVRRRRARRRAGLHRQRLAAAAVAVLLLGSGVAAAMPGSPIRSWLSDEMPEQTTEVAPGSGAALALAPQDGRARVELQGLGREVAIEVALVSGDNVEIEAPVAAAFQTGPGWARVSGGHEEGSLRIRMPEEAREVEVSTDGTRRVELREGRLWVDGVEVADPGALEEGEWIRVPTVPADAEREGT